MTPFSLETFEKIYMKTMFALQKVATEVHLAIEVKVLFHYVLKSWRDLNFEINYRWIIQSWNEFAIIFLPGTYPSH